MKKSVALILTLVMMMGMLVGCGGGDSKGKDEDVKKEFELGVITDDKVYTNDFADIKFTLPEGWIFASEEEIAELMGMGADEFFGDDNQKAIEYAMDSTVYDMMASYPMGGDNVIVMFENTARYPGGTSMTAQDYIDVLVENLNEVEGFEYNVVDTKDMKVGGQEYTCLSMVMEAFGVYQDYLIRREGKYMICIAISSLTESPLELIGENFS